MDESVLGKYYGKTIRRAQNAIADISLDVFSDTDEVIHTKYDAIILCGRTVNLLKSGNLNGNKIIIDFSSDFQYGGGTDSVYSRMMQLIKTALANTENKNIYLYLDGKQVNFIGGEGIMITQPLNEKSLEV